MTGTVYLTESDLAATILILPYSCSGDRNIQLEIPAGEFMLDQPG